MCRQILMLICSVMMLCCVVEVAIACSCTKSPSPCSSLKNTPAVFVGRVLSIKEDTTEITQYGKKHTVRTRLLARFAVEESLKGIKQETVEVVTGGGGGDCGYPFEAGKRYLVYAYGSNDEVNSAIARTVIGGVSKLTAPLSANICSRTRSIERAIDDIELIRAANQGKPETRIFGYLAELTQPFGDQYNIAYVGPLAGVQVKVESGNNRYEALTDTEGRYVLRNVIPGDYAVNALVPHGYGPLYDFPRTEPAHKVTVEDCGTEVNFEAQVDGRVSGTVADADGSKVADQVQISMVTLESATKGITEVKSRSEYTKNGKYEFDGLAPGKYLIGVNIAEPPAKNSPYPKVFYPDASDAAQGRVITVELGQKVTTIDFVLPPKLQQVIITGIVVNRNGKPVSDASVKLIDQEESRGPIESFDTDKQGRFTAIGFQGRRYYLHASKPIDYLAGTGSQSELFVVESGNTRQAIKLVLNKPGIYLQRK